MPSRQVRIALIRDLEVNARYVCHSKSELPSVIWKIMRAIYRLALNLALSVVASTAAAQPYPGKPVRVVVPYPAGGAVDVATRQITNHMAQALGQPFVIDNRPGANANIGTEIVARAAPDGYTLLASATFLLLNPLLESDLRWGPHDFAPVALFATSPNILVVPASHPSRSLAEFIALAKAKPGLSAGDAGRGAPQTTAIELLKHAAGVEFANVSYRGGPQLLADLLNGQLDMSVLPASVAMSSISGGRIRALASTSNRRSPLLPDLPTMAESGYADVTVISWYGFHVPAGTPRHVIDRLSDAIGAASSDEATRSHIEAIGGEISFMPTETFQKFLASDSSRWIYTLQTIKRR